MSEETRLQSFRRGPTGRVFQVEAHHHPDSRQHIVFWEDIQELFPGAKSVLNGTVAVSRARDASFRFIEPRCIKYQPEKVLEVVGVEDLTTLMGSVSLSTTAMAAGMLSMAEYPQQLTHRNIEQWAKATAEITVSGTMYPPSVYSQSTVTSRPFKPLIVPTEADASSVHSESVEEDEDKEEKEKTADENEADEEILRSPIIAISPRDAIQWTSITINHNPVHEEEGTVEEEEEEEEEEESDSEENKVSSSDPGFQAYLELPTDNLVLFSGLPHFIEYNGNGSASNSVNCITSSRSDGNLPYDNNYMPVYLYSSNNGVRNIKSHDVYYNNNESDPMSAAPFSPMTASYSSLPYPPLPLPQPSLSAPTKPLAPSKNKPAEFIKPTFNSLVRRNAPASTSPSEFRAIEDEWIYMKAQDELFCNDNDVPQQQHQQEYPQMLTQQQQILTQQQQQPQWLQEDPWLREDLRFQEKSKQLYQQHHLALEDYERQFVLTQRENGFGATMSVGAAPGIGFGTGPRPTLGPNWHGGGQFPQMPRPVLVNARYVDAESARRRVQERQAAERDVADRLAQFMAPPLSSSSLGN